MFGGGFVWCVCLFEESRLKQNNHWRHHGTLPTFTLHDTVHGLHSVVVDLSHLSDTHPATFLPSLLNKMREKMMEKLLGWNNDREITNELPLLVNDLTYGKY